MSRQPSAKNSSSSSPHTVIERHEFVTEVPASTITTTTTTSTGENLGNLVLSRNTTYDYLKISESLAQENVPRSKVSAPGVTSHQRKDYDIRSGSERNSYTKESNENYSYLHQLNAQPSCTERHDER